MSDLTIFGLTFHWYGLIVGSALVLGWQLVEWRWQQAPTQEKKLQNEIRKRSLWLLLLSSGTAALVGARVWHLVTDWQLYGGVSWQLLAVWNGGLSILGAVLFGALGLVVVSKVLYVKKWWSVSRYLFDLLIFGLPIAQAVGRLGNWVNQELYGLPTKVPWAIAISEQNRLPKFIDQSYYHPLFAYEALATGIFGVGLWWYFFRTKRVERVKRVIGSGKLALLYLVYYSVIRFLLDFLRLDRSSTQLVFGIELGVNQVVLLLFILVGLYWLLQQNAKKLLVVAVAGAMIGWSTWQWVQAPFSPVAQQTNYDSDEVVWVLDAEAYVWYSSGDWQRFQPEHEPLQYLWYQPEYRALDQPQLAKYLMGGLLTQATLRPWQLSQKESIYSQFSSWELPDSLIAFPSELSELVESVIFVRRVHTVVGLVFIAIAAVLAAKFFSHTWIGVTVFLLLSTNQLITTYYRLATASVWAFVFQLLAISTMVWWWSKYASGGKLSQNSLVKNLLWGLCSGGLVAAATSVKLDGAFLFLSPFFLLWVWLWNLPKKVAVPQFRDLFTWFLAFLVGVGGVFLLLEPILWPSIPAGLQKLFGARLYQQERFLISFDHLNVLEVFWLSLQQSARLSLEVWIWLAFFFLTRVGDFACVFTADFYQKWRLNLSLKLLLFSLVPAVLGSFWYARVGFGRYVLPIVIWYYVVVMIVWALSITDEKNQNK